MTAQSTSGRAINVIPGIPALGDHPFTDRAYTFENMGTFADRPNTYYVQPAQDDKDTPADSVMWTLNVPVPVTVYLDFWGGDHHVNNLRVGNDWLQAETSQWVRQPDEVGTMFWTEAETPPGPVFARTFPAGQIEILGNGGSECSPCIGVGGHGTFFPFVEANC